MTRIVDNRRSVTVIDKVKNVGNELIFLILKNTDGHQAVEPRISNFFIYILHPLLLNGFMQSIPLVEETGARNDTTIEVGVIMC